MSTRTWQQSGSTSRTTVVRERFPSLSLAEESERAALTTARGRPGATPQSHLPFRTEVPVAVQFVPDSPLEGDGFEPSVPNRSAPAFETAVERLATGNRKFESISLQGGVRCEPDFR